MTPRTKRYVAILSLTVAACGCRGDAAHAHLPGWRGFPGDPDWPGPTGAQKEQIKAILKDGQPRLEPLVDEMVRSRRALFEAVSAPTFDEGAIRAAADTAARAATTLAVERARTGSLLRGVLTAEQQARFDEGLRRMGERMAKRGALGRRIWREHAADFVDAL
jgi:hypothetical protein